MKKRYVIAAGLMMLLLIIAITGSYIGRSIGNSPTSFLNPIKGNAEIDWIDFVHWENRTYESFYERILSNPDDVTDIAVGEVKFKIAGVVTNPRYRTQNGDASFLKEGTLLYQINGFKTDEVIAAEVESEINGYRVYFNNDIRGMLNNHYIELPKNKVKQIELYHKNQKQLINILDEKESEAFIKLLEAGSDQFDFIPDQSKGDPSYYYMVFYTDEPFAYKYLIVDDGTNVYFHPWNTRLVDQAIRQWLIPEDDRNPM